MTVGISFTNGLEAVVITDRRVSMGSRQSDSVNKLAIFDGQMQYRGVVFGAGNASFVNQILSSVGDVSASNFSEFTQVLFRKDQIFWQNYVQSFIESNRGDVYLKGLLLPSDEERQKFAQGEAQRLIQEIDRAKQSPDYNVQIAIVGFDDASGSIRQFYLDHCRMSELVRDNFQIGSGVDGSNIYFAEELQGIDSSKLKMEELLYFALNSYSLASIDAGVGGTPNIVLLSKEGAKPVPRNPTVAMANLVGAERAGIARKALSGRSQVVELISGLLEGTAEAYSCAAKSMGVNENTLTGIYIPPASWKEASNAMDYATRLIVPK